MLEVLRYMHTRDQSNVKGVEDILLYKDFNALNAMYVKDVEDGIYSFYAILHMEYCCSFTHVKGVEGVKYYVLYSVYRAPHSSRREGYLKTTRVIAGKMHSQYQFLKLRGHSATQ